MVERNTDVQYDDDLTIGADDYDESLYDGDIDLFEYVGEEESAITRLKTIILSIDWEITDDILRELNEELHELKDIWRGEKVHLVYVQALEKLSRYIYQERADANPNAIKLLLTFYTDLEKIVLDENMDEEEKKSILIEDVKRFEKFKTLIGSASSPSVAQETPPDESVESIEPVEPAEPVESIEPIAEDTVTTVEEEQETLEKHPDFFTENEDILLNLKAIVFGIDWEITAKDLEKLDKEVQLLKNTFAQSKVRILFLQGIETLGNYINVKRSDAHIDAFKILHTFFAGLETVVKGELSYDEEKALLLSEVDKFNSFKEEISKDLAPGEFESFSSREELPHDSLRDESGDLAPALTAFGETSEKEPEVEEPVQPEVELSQDAEVEDITTEMTSRLENFFGDDEDELSALETSEELALQGVAVETEADDDSDEEELPRHGDSLAPALSDDFDGPVSEEPGPGIEPPADSEEEISEQVDGFFGDEIVADQADEPLFSESVGADDDLAPALGFLDDDEETDKVAEETTSSEEVDSQLDNFFEEENVEPALGSISDTGEEPAPAFTEEPPADVTERLDGFFDETVDQPSSEDAAFALQGVDVETEADDDSEEEPLLFDGDEVAPALGAEDPGDRDFSSEETVSEETVSEDVESRLEGFFDEQADGDLAGKRDVALQGVDVETEADDDSDEDPLLYEGDDIAPALGGDEDTPVVSALAGEEAEETPEEISEKLDGFFDDTTEAMEALPEEEVTSGSADALLEESEALPESEMQSSSEEIDTRLENFFDDKDEPLLSDDSDIALQGVDVETDADDDSGEAPLPIEGDEVAPALMDDEAAVTLPPTGTPALLDDDYSFMEYDADGDDEENLLGSAVNESDNEPVGVGAPSAASGVVFEAVDEEPVVFEPVEDESVVFEAVNEEDDDAAFFASLDDSESEGEIGDEGLLPLEDDLQDSSALLAAAVEEAESLDDDALVNIIDQSEGVDEDKQLLDEIDLLDDGEFLDTRVLHTEDFQTLAKLQDSVALTGGAFNENTLSTLNNEIIRLSEHFDESPLEKTFLQLMTSVSHYLGRHKGYEKPEANTLLFSIIGQLEQSMSVDPGEAQQLLQTETQKVLNWQQGLIDRLLSKPDESSDLLGVGVSEGLVDDDLAAELGDNDLISVKRDDAEAEKISSILASEFAAMREEFKAEMQKLRQELKDEMK